ncbi:MAG: metal-binding protein [Nitrospirae bacterium]|nr:MAG: metal-binding protein [Nitrospirota bacterium]
MANSFRYFKNKDCEFFPCHDTDTEAFNCLFCFCPLYYSQCPGEPVFLAFNGSKIKDCSNCDFPHRPENYETIIEIIKELNQTRPDG